MSGQLMLYAKSGAIIALKIIAPLFLQYKPWPLILSSSDVTIKEKQMLAEMRPE